MDTIWSIAITVISSIVLGVVANLLTDKYKGLKTRIETTSAGKREVFKWAVISFVFSITGILFCFAYFVWASSQPVSMTMIINSFCVCTVFMGLCKPILVEFSELVRLWREL